MNDGRPLRNRSRDEDRPRIGPLGIAGRSGCWDGIVIADRRALQTDARLVGRIAADVSHRAVEHCGCPNQESFATPDRSV